MEIVGDCDRELALDLVAEEPAFAGGEGHTRATVELKDQIFSPRTATKAQPTWIICNLLRAARQGRSRYLALVLVFALDSCTTLPC